MLVLSLPHLLLLEVLVLGASIASGITAFGFPMIMSPLFLLFLPPQTVVDINLALSVALTSVIAVQSRRHLDRKVVAVLIVGSICTMPLGILALNALTDSSLRLLILGTAMVQVFIPMIGLRHNFKHEMGAAFPVGAVVGFLATTVAMGGPMVVLLALNQRWDKVRTRANLAAYFAVSDSIVIGFHKFAGFYHLSDLVTAAYFLPALVLGVMVASRLVGIVNEKLFKYAILAVLFGASLSIIGREIFHYLVG